MDLVTNSAIELSTLALNGLSARHNALAANIANADTPGYQRVDVNFEDQLAKIMQKENILEVKKVQNSLGLVYNPVSLNSVPVKDLDSSFNKFGSLNVNSKNLESYNPEDLYKNFKLETAASENPAVKFDGNNVSMEYEMAELAKNGTKYTAIATFQEKIFKGLQEVIQRGGSVQ